MEKKNQAAVALGKRRWAGKTKAQKTAAGRAANEARNATLSPAKRKRIAKNAAKARWAKKTSEPEDKAG